MSTVNLFQLWHMVENFITKRWKEETFADLTSAVLRASYCLLHFLPEETESQISGVCGNRCGKSMETMRLGGRRGILTPVSSARSKTVRLLERNKVRLQS